MNALIIVDLQNDLCPDGTLAVPDGDAVIPTINWIQAAFDLVVDAVPPEYLKFPEE